MPRACSRRRQPSTEVLPCGRETAPLVLLGANHNPQHTARLGLSEQEAG